MSRSSTAEATHFNLSSGFGISLDVHRPLLTSVDPVRSQFSRMIDSYYSLNELLLLFRQVPRCLSGRLNGTLGDLRVGWRLGRRGSRRGAVGVRDESTVCRKPASDCSPNAARFDDEHFNDCLEEFYYGLLENIKMFDGRQRIPSNAWITTIRPRGSKWWCECLHFGSYVTYVRTLLHRFIIIFREEAQKKKKERRRAQESEIRDQM